MYSIVLLMLRCPSACLTKARLTLPATRCDASECFRICGCRFSAEIVSLLFGRRPGARGQSLRSLCGFLTRIFHAISAQSRGSRAIGEILFAMNLQQKFRKMFVFREKVWGERRGLNPRPSVPQTDALPAELRSPHVDWKQFNTFFITLLLFACLQSKAA